MKNTELKWADVPDGWALCFNEECSRHEQCLRWKAGRLTPEDMVAGRCVMPQALKDGSCRCFATAEKAKMARGFSHIYDLVLKSDYTRLRKSMTSMLSGKRYYYEYMRGERLLSPEKQEIIRQLFTAHGYGHCVEFDDYKEAYVFPWI
jgi:hypothetical protein